VLESWSRDHRFRCSKKTARCCFWTQSRFEGFLGDLGGVERRVLEGLGVDGVASYEGITGVSGSPVSTVLRTRVMLVSRLIPVAEVSLLMSPTTEMLPSFPDVLEGSGGEASAKSWTLSPQAVRRQTVPTGTTDR